jgi:cellulose synthase/poly-beta-1,6-N-acetylglucosamine synthase-like glycosyltransferase
MVVAFPVIAVYCLLLLVLRAGWSKAIRHCSGDNVSSIFISVIVPFRNEATNLPQLLHSLTGQSYRHFEILLVNDHSEDDSLALASKYLSANMRVIDNAGTGKKSAITTGVMASRGEVIVTTDADCQTPPEWLQHIANYFQGSEVKFAFGPVRIATDGSFFSHLQALEFSSLIGSGAAAAAWTSPVMCNGANVAYRKVVFEEVDGYTGNVHVASGDDEFLMRKVAARYPGGAQFMGDKEVIVTTKAASRVTDFFSQRLRWASKWKHNTSAVAIVAALVVWLIQLSWLVVLVQTFIVFTPTLGALVAAKLAAEIIFLWPVCRFLYTRWSFASFFALQLLYPVYVVAIGIMANFLPNTWKGRSVR